MKDLLASLRTAGVRADLSKDGTIRLWDVPAFRDGGFSGTVDQAVVLAKAGKAANIAANVAEDAGRALHRREQSDRQKVMTLGLVGAKNLYCYDSDLIAAGVIVGRDGKYVLGSSVKTVFYGEGMNTGKQFGSIPSGSTVSVRWLADMAGRDGFGPNRKRRALVGVE